MKTTLKDFNTSLRKLQAAERNGEEISQNHFGDFLMIEEETGTGQGAERYKVWLNHPENVKQGESRWQIEYSGKSNQFTWETISQGNE